MRTLAHPRRLLATVVAASVVFLAGCGIDDSSGTGGDDSTKHINLETVIPANTGDAAMVRPPIFLNAGAGETLIGVDRDTSELFPWLVQSWESEDATNWTITLREGITFHNGDPVDAEAVKTSLEYAIANNPGMEVGLRIEEMQADGLTLTVRTEPNYASFPSQLAHYNLVIVDVDASTEAGYPIATGPFAFTSFDPNTSLELERYEDYWDGQAALDSVSVTANEDANARMLALQSGQADIIYRPSLESLNALRGDSSVTVDTVRGTRVYHLMYNFREDAPHTELWNNTDFRKGIDAMIDRQSIADALLRGEAVATDNALPGDGAASPEMLPFSYDVDAALEHFAAAGLEVTDGQVTDNGQPLQLTMGTYIARPELPQIAQAVQASLAEVGIGVSIETAENIDEYLATPNWDFATFSLSTLTRGDGSYFVNGAFIPGGAQNYGQVNDPALTARIEEFNSTVDATERATLMRGIIEYLREEAINAYIVAPQETAAYRDGVTNWKTPRIEFEFPMITKELDITSTDNG